MGGYGGQIASDMSQAFSEAKGHKRQRKEQLTDEQRRNQIDQINNAGLDPGEAWNLLNTVYDHEPHESRVARFGRWLARRKGNQQQPAPQSVTTQNKPIEAGGITIPPETQTSTVQGPAPRNKQEAIGNAIAQHGVTRYQAQAEKESAANKASQRRISEQESKAPSATALKREDYEEAVRNGYKGSPEQWAAEESAKGRAAGTPPKTAKVGSFEEFVKEGYGDSPTAEQILDARRRWTAAVSGTTVGSHTILVPQPDGSIKTLEVTTTSRKDFGGGAPAPRKTPAPKAGRVKSGDVVGGRMTADVVKARKDYEDAIALADTAKSVSQHPDDAINQKRLAVQLERLSAGRFTTQALDYVIKAGWGNTIEQWANNPSTGALPKDVMRQLVDGADQYLHATKAKLDAAQSLGKTSSPAPKGGESDDDVENIIKALKGKPR